MGDLLYRLTADTFAIQTLTMNGFFPILTSLVLLGGMVVVMLQLDWQLTAVSLLIVPLLFVTIARLSHRITALSTDARVKESALWAVAQRTIGAIRVIQAFTTEEEEHRKFVGTTPRRILYDGQPPRGPLALPPQQRAAEGPAQAAAPRNGSS